MIDGPLSAPSSPPETPVPTKWMPLLAQRRLAADGVVEVRVAAVDDDVARLEQRGELVDDRVGGLAGLHHDDDGARPLERGDEVLEALGRDEVALVAVLVEQALHLGVVRLWTATVCPWRAKLRARLRPITARPVTPMVARALVGGMSVPTPSPKPPI